jgi:hypothetical protein
VVVVIDEKGVLHVGGEKVKEEKNGEMVYEGGLSGYVREGFGGHSFEKYRR